VDSLQGGKQQAIVRFSAHNVNVNFGLIHIFNAISVKFISFFFNFSYLFPVNNNCNVLT